MMPNIERGGRMTGLLIYLTGPGRANEHVRPHIVAGDDTVLATVEEGRQLERDDAVAVARTLDQPRKMYGRDVTMPVHTRDPHTGERVRAGSKDAHVWHCSLALRADDTGGPLTDEAWKLIAEQFVDGMGFIDPDGAKSSRWVAIHHGLSKNGNDHIHIAVQMVTEDGSRARVHNDFSRAQKICRDLEREHGLTITEGADRGQTLPHEKRWERERHTRERSPFVERKELRRRLRGAAAGATSEAEFVQRVASAGVLIRPRFATGGTSAVTGYAVALPPPAGVDRAPIFYSPAKHLDKNLSLPKVREALEVDRAGDPEAVPTWREHHSTTRGGPPKLQFSPPSDHLRQRLAAGTVDAGALARIYASASLVHERETPGPLAQASEHLASVAAGPIPAGYMGRLLNRAHSENAAESWRAILVQAVRLSRALADREFESGRAQLKTTHMAATGMVIDHYKLPVLTASATDAGPPARGPGGGRELTARERALGTSRAGPPKTSQSPARTDHYRDHPTVRDDGRER